MSLTDERPGPAPAPIAHPLWCAEHGGDQDDARICFSAPLRLEFGDRGPTEDAVNRVVLSLLRDPQDGVKLTVLAGLGGMSLDPDQIRPFAMALLAYDALANSGDLDAHAYYRAQAENGATR